MHVQPKILDVSTAAMASITLKSFTLRTYDFKIKVMDGLIFILMHLLCFQTESVFNFFAFILNIYVRKLKKVTVTYI